MKTWLSCGLSLVALACSITKFEPASLVEGVRILAISADQPYAAPGATVKLKMLAVDGRAVSAKPMNTYFFPTPCVNPARDAYYACFPEFGAMFQPGVDIGNALLAGAELAFDVPNDILSARPSAEQYGLLVTFAIACRGHVEFTPLPTGGSVDAVPFACFDDAGNRLGADDFVFAYSLVYVFNDLRNENPVIDAVTLDGQNVDLQAGISIEHCTSAKIDDCPARKIDMVVSDASQEIDPINLDKAGQPLREQIYVQYFATAGEFKNDTMVLFDPRAGRLSSTFDEYRGPLNAGEYQLWAVVHDNRGGVSWSAIPVHVD